MKKCVLVIFMSVLLLPLWAQHNGHSLSVDFGSYRNRYVYPITNIQYTSPVIEGLNLRGTARLRSYGTWFFYSKTPMTSHFLPNITLEVRSNRFLFRQVWGSMYVFASLTMFEAKRPIA